MHLFAATIKRKCGRCGKAIMPGEKFAINPPLSDELFLCQPCAECPECGAPAIPSPVIPEVSRYSANCQEVAI